MPAIKNDKTDYELIEEILAGNTRLYGVLQDRYKYQIKALIRKMIYNPDDADDLAQETFIKTYNALDRFQPGYTFSSWLYRIASNTCIDFLRKRRFPTISVSKPIGNDDSDLFFEIEDKTPNADILIIADERHKVIRDAINELPEKYRNIIALRHEDDMDYKDIAEKLNLPLGTVKAQLFRARKLLLELLKDNTIFAD